MDPLAQYFAELLGGKITEVLTMEDGSTVAVMEIDPELLIQKTLEIRARKQEPN
jgi:hypothetical protein